MKERISGATTALNGGRRRRSRLTATVTSLALIATGLTVFPATATAAAELPTPVLRYTFDSVTDTSAGTVIPDAAGNVSATLKGAGASVSAGPSGLVSDKAITLPGGGNTSGAAHLELNSLTAAFAGKTDATLSYWMKWDGGNSCSWAATLGVDTTHHLFNSPDCSGFLSAVNVNGETRTSGSAAATKNTWMNIALVLKGGNSLLVYRDGTQIAAASTLRPAQTAAALFPTGSTIGGYIGKSFYSADPYFKGAIDDVRVYNSALTTEQVGLLGEDVKAAWAQEDASAITLSGTTNLTENLSLPSQGKRGSAITWTSSNDQVITGAGVITQAPDSTRSATLTASVSLGGATVTRAFAVSVASLDPSEAVASATSRLTLPTVIKSGMALPTELQTGVRISWATSTAGASISNGVITAATGTVKLVAKLSHGGTATTGTKTLDARVLAATDARDLVTYTRTADANPDVYSVNLANSMHLALEKNGSISPLNENYGVLFPKSVASSTAHQTDMRTMTSPVIFNGVNGGYGVVAVRTLSDGTPDSSAATSLLYFTSPDLKTFTEVGTVAVNPAGSGVRQPQVHYDSAVGKYVVFWRTAAGAPFYSVVGNFADPTTIGAPVSGSPVVAPSAPVLTVQGSKVAGSVVIDAAAAQNLEQRFGRIVNTSVKVDDVSVDQGAALDVSGVKAQLGYTDGSKATRAVDWNASDLAAVDTSVPGTYEINGTVRQTTYNKPFVVDGADPTVFKYNDSYLYIATRNENSNPGLWIRKSSSITGLQTASDNQILSEKTGPLRPPFWAPELHVIGGKLTILFASNPLASGWSVQAMAMQLKPGGDPTVAADWGTPAAVKNSSNNALMSSAITLDMTYYEDEYQGQKRAYYIWSGRVDWKDAWLYIATVDPANPWKLTSEPVAITHNDFAWNKNLAPIDEGPFIIRHGDTLNMTFSGSSTGHTYATGRLTAAAGTDLLNPASWAVDPYPVLKSNWSSTPVELGPGHNSFSVDEDGNEIFVYHSRDDVGVFSPRDTQIRRVHWAADGYPILDMTTDEEVSPNNRSVKAIVTVKAKPAALDAAVSVGTRCVAKKPVLAVTVKNSADVAYVPTVATTLGTKTGSKLEPGKSWFQTFSARTSSIAGGEVTVTVAANINGSPQTSEKVVPYEPTSCG